MKSLLHNVSLLVIALCLVGCGANQSAEKDQDGDKADKSDKKPPITERLAQVGVGKRGSASRQHKDGIGKIIAQPAVQYFNAKEAIVFNIQIPKLMQLHKAKTGDGIKSHQEFMTKIIEENRVKLPELPEGQAYEFKPRDQKLYVVPAKK